MKRRHISTAALIVGSNAMTALTMAMVFGRAVQQHEKHLEQIRRNIQIFQTALDSFIRATPREVHKPIVDNLAFEWTVRDLV